MSSKLISAYGCMDFSSYFQAGSASRSVGLGLSRRPPSTGQAPLAALRGSLGLDSCPGWQMCIYIYIYDMLWSSGLSWLIKRILLLLLYDLPDATATHHLLLQQNPDLFNGFTFLILAHPGSPTQRDVQRVLLLCNATVTLHYRYAHCSPMQ